MQAGNLPLCRLVFRLDVATSSGQYAAMFKRADEIKDMLRACTTVAQVNALARSLGPEVAEMAEHPSRAVHAIHIRNLAAYLRVTLEE